MERRMCLTAHVTIGYYYYYYYYYTFIAHYFVNLVTLKYQQYNYSAII